MLSPDHHAPCSQPVSQFPQLLPYSGWAIEPHAMDLSGSTESAEQLPVTLNSNRSSIMMGYLSLRRMDVPKTQV